MTIVLFKTALAKKALRAKAGIHAGQAGMRQGAAAVAIAVMLAVQAGPIVVAVDPAPLSVVMRGRAAFAILVAVIFDGGTDDCDCGEPDQKLAEVFAVQSLGLKWCGAGKGQ